MNIKKQIFKLYALDFLGSFNLTDGIWMILLVSRGFSLWQAGIVEGIFHVVSLICEIPSGMLADIYGRRRIMVLSWVAFILSNIAMIISDNIFLVAVSMCFCALGYNLSSGTRESLVYDSLLEVGEEKRYIKVSSWQSVIWSLTGALCKLLSGVALKLGYMICYGFGIITNFVGALVSGSLREATPPGRKDETQMKFKASDLPKNIKDKFVSSGKFIKSKPISVLYMLSSSGIGAFALMTSYMMQEHFVDTGASGTVILGVLLFIISLGGAVGAKLGPLLAKFEHKKAVPLCGIAAAAGICICAVGNPFIAAFGCFFAFIADSALATVTDARLNDMFPSSERATLVSVNSISFSLVMVVLSPAYGFIADFLGTSGSFLLCGIVLAALTVLGTLLFSIKNLKTKNA